jgi:hypothetical protein
MGFWIRSSWQFTSIASLLEVHVSMMQREMPTPTTRLSGGMKDEDGSTEPWKLSARGGLVRMRQAARLALRRLKP